MEIEIAFSANYEIGIPSELPNDGRDVLYFPPAESGHGLVYEASVKFTSAGQKAWYGVFAARSKQEEGLTVASTLPDPDSCFVSVLGAGYMLNVQRPADWAAVPLYPVRQTLVISDPRLMVLSCFTRLIAYGREGRKWVTERLCSDQLKIRGISGGGIECSGWDAPTGQEISVRVDIATGRLLKNKF